MPVNLYQNFLLYSRLRIHQWRVQSARQRIKEWLRLVRNPYIAFSTGKDSTCLLYLVRAYSKDVPAVYFDADCAFPESREMLDTINNLILFPTKEPLFDTFHRFGKILSGEELERETMYTTVYEPIKRLARRYGFDGMAYGLRAEESRGRKISARVNGAVFRHGRDKVWACQPIHDWSYNDIWAYIVSNDIPYCKVYDKLFELGVKPEDCRLSYWAGETKRRWGRWAILKKGWPELFNRFAAEFPEVRCYV